MRTGDCSPTFVDVIRDRAAERPQQQLFVFLQNGEEEVDRLTFDGLDRRARAIAAELSRHARRDDRALMLYPPGLDFVAAFFGCLYAGIWAVPSYPPRRRRAHPRLRAIARDAAPKLVLTTAAIAAQAEVLGAQVPELKEATWCTTDDVAPEMADVWDEPHIIPASPAFLQYTSGSTSMPKGVVITHANLLHNQAMLQRAFETSEREVFASWLPPYHDMGLIGTVLHPAYVGGFCILMSPMAFLQKPRRWLEIISRYGVTISGGPNFAFELCVRKIVTEERQGLDLGSWCVAFNGAEPVRSSTLEDFAEAFGACGFRRRSFYPCYGLAEATLFVSGGRRSVSPVVRRVAAAALEDHRVVSELSENRSGRGLVGSGRAWGEQRLAVVDPQTSKPCPPDRVGEIWISGPSVAQGYWARPQETEDHFRARLSEAGTEESGGPFLRTGDLGFLERGELFVTGRLKDLIIVRGRNLYPQDLELSAERCHPALRRESGAAFTAEVDGEERLVMVQEVERRSIEGAGVARTVMDLMRAAVARDHEVSVHEVVLVRSGTIPRTSSGKIQRHLCRQSYREDRLAVVARSAGQGADSEEASLSIDRDGLLGPDGRPGFILGSYLRSLAARVLQIPVSRLDPGRPLTAFGLDSMSAVELQHEMETNLGVSLPFADLLSGSSLEQVSAAIGNRLRDAPTSKGASRPKIRNGRAETRAGGQIGVCPVGADATEYPLSYGQEALVFLDRMAGGGAAYVIPGAARVRGPLAVADLRNAFRGLVERHGALRTSFLSRRGEPIQRVHAEPRIEFVAQEASSWSEAELLGRLSEEAYRPFDLERDPLLRVRVFRRSPCEHLLVLSVHHAVADFWSLEVLLSELTILYKEGGAPSVPLELPVLRYSDFVFWQRRRLAGPEGHLLQEYWRTQLEGSPSHLDLPTDRPRPKVQGFDGSSEGRRLDADLSARLLALAAERSATPFHLLLAAFQSLLYRYSGQGDVIVGSPTSGRGAAELAGVVGYFVNPVAVRSRVGGNLLFEVLLTHVCRTVLGALEHQEYPFPLLVDGLRRERDPSRSPIFQVMFALHKARSPAEEGLAAFALGAAGAQIELGDLEVESVALPQRSSQFDLSLSVAQTRTGFSASVEYGTALYDRRTIRRMLRHFETLLLGIACDPGLRLSELPLLTTVEMRQLVEWNDTWSDQPTNLCAHELIEVQVERTPEAVAVKHEEEVLSYQELSARANRLACILQGKGAGPEERVGIYAERSPEFVVGLLGVLKAGAAYVPLDPSSPRERLDLMLADARLAALLTQERLLEKLTSLRPEAGLEAICLDSFREEEVADSVRRPMVGAVPESLAYVIFTSGTTGRPKGVEVSHGALLNYVCDTVAAFRLEPGSRVLQFASLSFDHSVEEIYPALIAGSQVVLRNDAMLASVPEFLEACRRWRVTALTLTTTYWHELAVAPETLPASIELMVIGGEKARADRLGAWWSKENESVRLLNTYGPTEATVVATRCTLDPPIEESAEVPIGRPLRNVRAFVLGSDLRPVPVGVPGELHIGGAGLARGYLRQPIPTAERFVPNPLADRTGERIYKSGDLVRWRPEGRLEYLGRIDLQVKIRGFRIEVEEVESALEKHPAVRRAVVVEREFRPGDSRLVAYVVPETDLGRAPEGDLQGEMRAFLKHKLPEYMVPSALVTLDALPLSTSGKVNRRALPAPRWDRRGADAAHLAPRTPIEEMLAGIWSEVLGLERVGVLDDFFALGGNSLLTFRVMSRIREKFPDVSPGVLFPESYTVAGLAAAIENHLIAQATDEDLEEILKELEGS